MKRIIVVISIVAAVASLQAQTNLAPVSTTALTTNTASGGSDKEYGSYELTLGGGGITSPKTGDTQFALDATLSTDPFKKLPNLWIGAAQSLSWEPSFAGETDIFSDYSWHLHKQLWLNTGWSVGGSYAAGTSIIWHTGPEASFEYYVGDSAFLFVGINFDMVSRGDNNFPYKFGIGLTW